jgi:hypothetical protein
MAGTYDIEDALGMAMGMIAYCWVYCYRAGLGNLHRMPHRRCRSVQACCSQASAGGDAHGNNTGRPFRNCVKRTNPVCDSCVTQFSTCS